MMLGELWWVRKRERGVLENLETRFGVFAKTRIRLENGAFGQIKAMLAGDGWGARKKKKGMYTL